MQVYQLITCVRRANENAGNLISVVQFLIIYNILYGALRPKSDVDRVYVARQKGGRGLISCEMCVKAEDNNLAWYVRN